MQCRIQYRNPDQLRRAFPEEPELWAVDLSRQRILRLRPNGLSDQAPVSTSRYGLGNRPGSYQTPLGPHRIREVVGAGAAPGRRFVTDWRSGAEDAILTRILWLDGLVPGLNGNSFDRYIYLHGTNREDLLGTPASHGCVRMANAVIAEWADALGSRRPMVWIGGLQDL